MTDWNKEAEGLGTGVFWKPETGIHKVKFLDNGTPTTFKNKKTNEETEQVNFKAVVNGQEKEWTVTKAKTVNSLYGQLVLLGRYYGSLEGKEITVLVKFDQNNNKREYTVQEALPLIGEWNKKQELKKGTPTGGSSDARAFM